MGKPRRSDPSPFLPSCGPDSGFCLVVTTPENLVPSDSALYFLSRRQDPERILVPLLGARSDTRGTGKSVGDFLSDSLFRRAGRRMNHPEFRLPLNAVSMLGAAGPPSERHGMRCPWPGSGARRGRLACPTAAPGSDPRRGKAAAPAGFVQGSPSKPPRRTRERRGRRHLQITSEKSCRANIPARLGRAEPAPRLLLAPPRSAREMPAERRAGLRARPALLPRRTSPGCLQVPAGCTPHPSLAAFQMPKPKVFSRREKRVAGGQQSRSKAKAKPASNPARAPSPRSWMQAHAALRIPSSPRAFPRWRWVRSPSCKCLFISYGALKWESNK